MLTKQMVEDAQKLLGLDGVPLTEDNIKLAFRTVAKTAHPDAGGEAAQFAAADKAKCILLEWLKKAPDPVAQFMREDCPNCRGTGSVTIPRGFGRLRIMCGRCKGTGDAGLDVDVQDT